MLIMAPDISQARTAGLGHWLARQAPVHGHLDSLLQSFCRELTGRGLPLWRVTLGFEILHPETSGKMITWIDDVVTVRRNDRANSLGHDYCKSPVKIVDETDRPFRLRLDRPSPDLPMLEELRADGATDYVIFPLPFLDKRRTAFMSFASRSPGGFGTSDLAEMEIWRRPLSAPMRSVPCSAGSPSTCWKPMSAGERQTDLRRPYRARQDRDYRCRHLHGRYQGFHHADRR
jgi:hypothetical protein